MPDMGRVLLVGAGPGDPELITVRGARALAAAEVVLYDELASEELLDLVPERALKLNVGKRGHEHPTRSQADINALLIEHARAGRRVVRLKGGDPLVFGRGGEEASACAAEGIPFEIVPGVSSAIAVPAYAGIPVTDRRYSASFAVVTGHKDPSRPAEQTRWRELATAVDTVVILMGMRNLARLVDEMIDGGRSPETPAAAVMQGTLGEQRTCVAPLRELPEAVRRAGLGAPAAVVVGSVVRLREELAWWEKRPLFGRRVLITRPREQAGELAALLRAAGALPVIEPMIELGPIDSREGRDEIARVLDALEGYSMIVFTSSNAVRHFAIELEAHRATPDPAVPRARVFCIGDRTARAALDAGLPVHGTAAGRGDAEALLGDVRAVVQTGERVLIPRSEIGRTVIAAGLRAAGTEVDSVAFYTNRRPATDLDSLRRRLVEGRLDAITFTSPSTVDHFVACLDDESRASAGRCMIAAIGRTTARRLEELGLPVHAVPERPEVAAMVTALERTVVQHRGAKADPETEPTATRADDPDRGARRRAAHRGGDS